MTGAAWKAATWAGNRLLRHEAFMALPFREKIREIERMEELRALFESQRARRTVATSDPGADTTASR